ncbi:hypothetical protein V8F06_008953 [Rhypophila decipiens]
MHSQSPLQWQQTSPGVYQRDIDGVERFYLAANSVRSPVVNKADWHVSSGVKLECSRPNFAQDFKKAWIRTRLDYPGLAATIEDDRWNYHTVDSDPNELDSWLKETFHVHRIPLTARELLSEDILVPAPRVVLHVLLNTQELLLQGPHTHLDGFGLMKTFQHLISCLVQIPLSSDDGSDGEILEQKSFGSDEGRNLTPPMSICCPISPLTEQEKKKWDDLMTDFIKPTHKIYLDAQNHDSPPRYSRTQFMVFDPRSTKTLQDEAQKRRVSIAAILQGAISLAARKHGKVPTSSAQRHAFQALYSVREYIDPTIADGNKIVSPLVLGVPLTYTLHEDFNTLVADADRVIKEGKKDAFGLKCAHLWGSDLPKAFAAPMPEGKLIRAEPQMSYVGQVDMYLREWNEDPRIEGSLTQCVDFWPGLDMLSANVVNSVYIFRGKLYMSLAYNETYHDEASMGDNGGYLGLIKEALEKGLGGEKLGAVVRVPGREEWMPEPLEI